MIAANRALGVAAELHLPELHGESVEEEQPSGEALTQAEDELDGLDGLDAAYDAGQHAQDATLGATGHHAGRRRRRVEASVAAVAGDEDTRLALEEENAAVHQRLVQEVTRVIR